MYIKNPPRKTWLRRLSFGRPKFIIIYFTAGVFFFVLGYFLHRSRLQDQLLDHLFNGFSYTKNYLSSFNVKVDKVYVDISYENYQKIAHQRDIALKIGNNYRTHPLNEGFVPITLRDGSLSLDGRARLKGGTVAHFGDEKHWSFKIKISGKNAYRGMKNFSLQHPRTRSYLNEWFFHRMLSRVGLIALRYEFVELILNGESYGVYAVEENMDKRLLENNHYREGPIINFNTNHIWNRPIPFKDDDLMYFYGSNVRAYGPNSGVDSLGLKNFHKAKSFLSFFRNGTLKTSAVFDYKELSMFFAVVDLFGGHHASALYNMKFYFNPLTSKIHPIGYDNQHIQSLENYMPLGDRSSLTYNTLTGLGKKLSLKKSEPLASPDWYDLVFSDPLFYSEYIASLELVSNQKFIEDFFKSNKTAGDGVTKTLYRSYPTYAFDFNKEILFNNAKYIRDYLNPGKTIQAYIDSISFLENKIKLEIANLYHSPVEILSVKNNRGCVYKTTPNTLIQAMGLNSPVEYQNLEINIEDGGNCWSENDEFLISFRLLGAGVIFEDKIVPWKRHDVFFENKSIDLGVSSAFIDVDSLNKTISIKRGSWTIDSDLIIPKNHSLYVLGGTTIDIINHGKIISFSPINFLGNYNDQILIHSSDNTGQGLLVKETNEVSVVRNTTFKNLSNMSSYLGETTGSITFYEAAVDFDNCFFLNNIRGDDFLNLIRSEVSITSCVFENVAADAIDGDFITGKITDTYFNKIGNDGVDFSGSVIDLNHITMLNVSDKAISVGEKSSLYANYITIENSEIGVTSKDLSSISINNITIINSNIGYTIYKKKPEFGPGKISIKSEFLENVKIPYLIEEGSGFTINNLHYQSSRKDIKELLYGVKYGKASE